MKLTLLAFLILLLCTAKIAVAQDYWQRINTPDSLWLTDVIVDNQGAILISSWHNFSKGGIYRSDDDGNSWMTANNGLLYPNASILALAQDNKGIIYAGGQSRIYKSLNSGNTWMSVYETLNTAANMYLIRCGYDSIILVGGENHNGIIRSGDNGITWQTVFDISHTGWFESITDIQFGPNGVIYACSRITMSNDPGMIYASYDQGRTWHVFCEAGYPMALGFDNYGRLLRGEFGSGLYRYDFATLEWEHILATGVSPQEILTVPDNKIFLGCHYWPSGGLGGAMFSANGGESFSSLNSGFGLSNNASEFAIDLVGRILTVNGAIFRSYDTVFTKNQIYTKTDFAVQVFPNPFYNNVKISLQNPNNQQLIGTLQILDIYGHMVHKTLFSGNEYVFDGSPLATGIYIVRLKLNNEIYSTKIIHF
jgi:photosystem II stability/assembly factor-like uncharacterized protein